MLPEVVFLQFSRDLVQSFSPFVVLPILALKHASQKHAYIILTTFNASLCSKIGVYRGIHFLYFSYFYSKT